jgi:phytoene dehydrogenase-like protein
LSEGHDAIVVGGGHNGLVAACYLARAGQRVLVVEALDRAGGGARTEEVVAGFRFDLHSAAHNIINMTAIPDELELVAAGLRYDEMDPFSIAVFADGRRVRFHRSVESTVASIAEHDPVEADAYRHFVEVGDHLVTAMLPAIRGDGALRDLPRRLAAVARVVRGGFMERSRDLLGPYDSLLRRWLPSELTRAPVAAFAAHAGVGPTVPGGAIYAFWQAAYHRFGQWHGHGGAQNLTDALLTRAAAWGVEVRTGTPVERIVATGGRVRGVRVGGEELRAPVVLAATDARQAGLELLDPPLAGKVGADLAATRRGNVVQALVHVATDRLPPYADARPGDHAGLQSYVERLGDLSDAWVRADAGELPDPLPLYAFTTSAIDDTLAPPGQHTVYLACPAAPAVLRSGWEASRQAFVDGCIAEVERHAPGFESSVIDAVAWTPDLMMAGQAWPGAHPMHLDIALDQLGPFRPTPALGDHRTPVGGFYLGGAGTNPAGGIAGTPGRQAARAALADVGVAWPFDGRRRRRR